MAYGVIIALLVLVVFGLGAMALSLLGGGRSTATHATPTATAMATATGVQPTATLPSFSVPNAVIRFGGGGQVASAQQCNGTQPLDGLSLDLDNSHSTISVDWWVSITDKMPDGKHIWASAGPPYGTLPAGTSTSVTLTPDPALCGEIQGKSSPVTYHATVFYAGMGSFSVTDTITPSQANSTPGGNGPPFPHP